ncbi:MAG: TonB-dependent receptor [Bacteroidales bacterium]|nr:TonB-dependent receptor [Bacteroidales bacterium]
MNRPFFLQLKSLMVFIHIVFVSICFGQSNLRGVVYSDETGLPVGQAHIFIEQLDKSTISDRDGYFVFNNISPATYSLRVSHVSFETKSFTIDYLAQDDERIDLALIEKSNLLKAIEVKTWFENQIASTIIESETLDRFQARDISEIVQNAPNVSGIKRGAISMDPVVRGFRSSQLNIQLDNGQRIEGGCPNRMDPTFSHVDIDQIEEIEIIKGPYALQYGPILGGIVRLKTIKPCFYDRPEIHLEASKTYESNWNGNVDHIKIYGGTNSLYFKLSGGQKEYKDYTDGGGDVVNASFSKMGYNGEFGTQINNQHHLVYTFSYAKAEDVEFPALPMDERLDITNLQSFGYKFLGKGIVQNIQMNAYLSEVDHTMDNKQRPFSDTVVAVSQIEAKVYGGKITSILDFNFLKPEIGIDFQDTRKDGNREKHMILQPGLPVKHEILWNQARICNTGFFMKLDKKYHQFQGVLTLRSDWNKASSDSIRILHPMAGEIYSADAESSHSNHQNFSASLAMNYEVNQNFRLSFALGRALRSPDMTERFITLLPIGYDRFDYLGNPNLKPETNNQLDLGVDWFNEKAGHLKLSGFYSVLQNFITGKRLAPSIQKPLTKDVLGVKRFENIDMAVLSGFELQYVSHEFAHFQLGLQMSLTYGFVPETSMYKVNDEGQVVDEISIQNDALNEIPPFESNFWIQYTTSNGKLQNRIRFRAVAAQNHISQSYNELGSPGFSLLNYDFAYKVNDYIECSGGINNILDQYYYEHLNRNILGSRSALYEPGRSFFLKIKLKI